MLMNKKANTNLILTIGVAVIIAIVMLGVVFTMVNNRTTQQSGSQDLINYSVALASVSLSDTNINLIVSEDTIINATTGADISTNCNITTKGGGGGTLRCDSGWSNSTWGTLINTTYTFTRSGYYTGASTRTIGNIIPILLAISIIGIIALMYGVGKKS